MARKTLSIPPSLLAGILRWRRFGVSGGSGVSSILNSDIGAMACRLDTESLSALGDIVFFVAHMSNFGVSLYWNHSTFPGNAVVVRSNGGGEIALPPAEECPYFQRAVSLLDDAGKIIAEQVMACDTIPYISKGYTYTAERGLHDRPVVYTPDDPTN